MIALELLHWGALVLVLVISWWMFRDLADISQLDRHGEAQEGLLNLPQETSPGRDLGGSLADCSCHARTRFGRERLGLQRAIARCPLWLLHGLYQPAAHDA